MCRFCDYYNELKQVYKKFEAHPEFSDFKHKHKVKIITYTYDKSRDYRKSGAYPSSILSRAFEIKYCPVCGKKLIKERKTEDLNKKMEVEEND